MQQLMKVAYEGIMILLVMLTIVTIWSENTYNSTINWIVWAVFTIDFIFRIITAENKWRFIKQNPFLVIAIIPIDQFFQVARIVRVIYLFRLKTITKYYLTPYVEKLTYKYMFLLFSLLLLVLAIESVVIWKMESTIHTYMDALFVVFSYLLFFAREVFVIENKFLIWVLTGTSIIGIVLQGLALQWAFTKLELVYKKIKEKRAASKDAEEIN